MNVKIFFIRGIVRKVCVVAVILLQAVHGIEKITVMNRVHSVGASAYRIPVRGQESKKSAESDCIFETTRENWNGHALFQKHWEVELKRSVS